MIEILTLEKLRDRVRAATGPDREIDLAVGLLWFGEKPFSTSVEQQRGGKPPVFAFTSSIDAALSLLWRIWPHANFELSCAANEGSYCLLTMPTDGGQIHLGDAEGNTPCLTILDALLSALINKEASGSRSSHVPTPPQGDTTSHG